MRASHQMPATYRPAKLVWLTHSCRVLNAADLRLSPSFCSLGKFAVHPSLRLKNYSTRIKCISSAISNVGLDGFVEWMSVIALQPIVRYRSGDLFSLGWARGPAIPCVHG